MPMHSSASDSDIMFCVVIFRFRVSCNVKLNNISQIHIFFVYRVSRKRNFVGIREWKII